MKSGNRPRLYRRGVWRGGGISSLPKRGDQDASVDIQELANDRRLPTSAAVFPAANAGWSKRGPSGSQYLISATNLGGGMLYGEKAGKSIPAI